MYPTGFKGRAKRLSDIDIPRIGRLIAVGEDEVRAVIEVETSGGGFDKQGRPKMLFEPHVFHRELGAGRKRELAINQGLAYPKWGAKPYPADSYPRLELDLHRFCSGLLRAMLSSKETGYGNATQ